MQYDEHVWAFRWYRFHLTGFMIGVVYSDGYHPIDPRDYFLSPSRHPGQASKHP